jgi:hypothetical protein
MAHESLPVTWEQYLNKLLATWEQGRKELLVTWEQGLNKLLVTWEQGPKKVVRAGSHGAAIRLVARLIDTKPLMATIGHDFQ